MHNRVLLGICCLCLGVLVFSLQDVLIKTVSGGYPVTEALAIRAIVAAPIVLALVRMESGFGALLSRRMGFLTLRGTIMFASYMAYYLAIAALPLSEAVGLSFTAPLVIVVLAVPYLGERLHWQTLLTVLVGLAGVIVMLQPGAAVFDWAALLVVLSACLYGFAQLMTRKVGGDVSAAVMTFYQNSIYLLGSLVVAGLSTMLGGAGEGHRSLAFLTRPWAWPTLVDFAMMAACGVIAAAGMVLLSQAYRMAPANRVATFEYTGILWAPLWGFLFFGEVPTAATLAGAALIVGAGLFALNFRRTPPLAGLAEASRLQEDLRA